MDRAHMTIANAVQNGRMVFVYGESARFLFSQTGELHDYACAHATIRKGSTIRVEDVSLRPRSGRRKARALRLDPGKRCCPALHER
jgi:hypothetical protein